MPFSAVTLTTSRPVRRLRVPSTGELLSMSKAQAVAEVNRQFSAWQAARGRGPSAAPASLEAVADDSGASSLIPMTDASADTGASSGTGGGTPAQTPKAESDVAADDAQLKVLSAGKSKEGGTGQPLPDEDIASLREQLKFALEEVEARRRENDELRSRLDESESLLEDMQRLLNLKDDSIAALRQKLENRDQEEAYVAAAEGGRDGSTPATGTPDGEPPSESPSESLAEDGKSEATSSTAEAGADTAAAPTDDAATATMAEGEKPAEGMASDQLAEGASTTVEQTAVVAVESPPQPTSTVDVLMGMAGSVASTVKSSLKSLPVDPKIAGGGAGVLALLGGWLWMRRRQGAAETVQLDVSEEEIAAAQREIDEATDAESTIVDETMPGALSEALDEEGASEAESASDTLGEMPSAAAGQEVTYDEDPLAEVNVYLAYERYEQAEELVREAIDQHPDRHDYKLKLLEIFVAANNVDGFRAYASELRSAVGDDSALSGEGGRVVAGTRARPGIVRKFRRR